MSKLNVDKILAVAEVLEKSKTYDQSTWFIEYPQRGHTCGTPACIAGHVGHMEGFNYTVETDKDISEFAQCVLGLDQEQADDLFSGAPMDRQAGFARNYGQPTNAHAARVLRKLAATGTVDWLGTKDAPKKPKK